MNIVVDFDGTICTHRFPGIGKPQAGVRDALLRMKKMGFKIFIHSCRTASYWKEGNGPAHQKARMEQYLATYGIPYDEIWMPDKQVATYYIDDRAIKFQENWATIIDEIEHDIEVCKACGQHDMGQVGENACPVCRLPLEWTPPE